MARYQHLSVYQSLYALSLHVYRLKLKLPKFLKHDLGEVFFETTIRLLRGVVLANGSVYKVRPLEQVLLKFETLWVYSRILFDLKAVSTGEFQVLSEAINGSGKQLNAWLKWERASNKQTKNDLFFGQLDYDAPELIARISVFKDAESVHQIPTGVQTEKLDDPEVKTKLIHKLLKRIEVTKEGIDIHFNVDKINYEPRPA